MKIEDLKKKFQDYSAQEIVAMSYLVILQRPIDKVGYQQWQEIIATQTFSPENLVKTLLNSPEYLMQNVPFIEIVHKSRMQWIRTIGSYEKILDIGGSSPNFDQGALIELGYIHRPKTLTIFDLPPDKQYWGAPKFSQDRVYTFPWGKLNYVHGEAEEISAHNALADGYFDLIFMGQVIEHLCPDQLPDVLKWIKSRLLPNGRFIFDTPNRLLTKLQSPDKFIDEDHKIEYEPEDLRELLISCGFKIEKQWGLLHMPSSFEQKTFNPMEAYQSDLLCNQLEQSYLFAFECSLEQ